VRQFPRTLLLSVTFSVIIILTACGGGGGGGNTISTGGGGGGGSNSANYVTCNPSNAAGPQRIPNYFASAFQSNYQNFIKAAIAHYGSNSQVGYIRFGLGRGGETIPVGDWDSGDSCSQQFAAWGLTDATINTTWEPYLQSMLSFEAANNASNVQLMVGITPMNGAGVPDFVAQSAAHLNIGFGSQGLQSSDVGNCSESTADWCELFTQYSGQVPLELQTIGQSCPQSPTSCPTGSLVTLLPFAVQNHATILELYYEDWLTAFDPSYSGGYFSSYAQAFTGVSSGSVSMNVLVPPGMAGNSDISTYVLNNSSAPVTGATFQVEWSEIDKDGSTGDFDWSYTDSAIASLPAGKQANFIFWANADSSLESCGSVGQYGSANVGNCAIPAYVWTQLAN
jgi:hypothetical protein